MSRRHLAVPITVITMLSAALPVTASAAVAGQDHAVPPLEDISVGTTEVASGLERPTAITALDDGSGRLLVVEKPGRVREFHPDTGLAPEPVLDITGRVNDDANERGLLAITPAPDFASSQDVYLAYTRTSDDAVTLSRFDVGSGTEQVLLAQEHSRFSNHNGGDLAFGSDGYLYWSLGDGGGAGDPFDAAQDLGTLLGKMLRIDVSRSCGELPYCIPEDNPFAGVEGARGEIWASGLRNPWRFSFDPADGSLWIGDVGQVSWEEVDHIAADAGGTNFGWSCMEGNEVYNQDRCDPGAEYTAPVLTYPTGTAGNCTVIGGHVYRGEQFADLVEGTYVSTDYCSGTARAVRENADGSHTSAEIGSFPQWVTTFGTDQAGELYLATDRSGQLHRVSFEGTAPPGCDVPAWSATTSYVPGDEVSHNGRRWESTWYSTGAEPGTAGSWAAWRDAGPC
ncbi:PQQ-dependent sugar dehydrogenase [Amycolatopsis aidingensis]|uniref:PQQ-dependent sugar dehydrogenase n=1 Tax=Amycolatopsis aidingensis TaxID=2842453 RepID=UPI001C0AB2C3|nr:PQQ-dependent sugar dehydrogenase [Amycolatopsis aidingensis]